MKIVRSSSPNLLSRSLVLLGRKRPPAPWMLPPLENELPGGYSPPCLENELPGIDWGCFDEDRGILIWETWEIVFLNTALLLTFICKELLAKPSRGSSTMNPPSWVGYRIFYFSRNITLEPISKYGPNVSKNFARSFFMDIISSVSMTLCLRSFDPICAIFYPITPDSSMLRALYLFSFWILFISSKLRSLFFNSSILLSISILFIWFCLNSSFYSEYYCWISSKSPFL